MKQQFVVILAGGEPEPVARDFLAQRIRAWRRRPAHFDFAHVVGHRYSLTLVTRAANGATARVHFIIRPAH